MMCGLDNKLNEGQRVKMQFLVKAYDGEGIIAA
jgi:hypothetical protein